MPSAAQIKKAIQPLLQRNPDLALVHRFVVIKPVHHIQRGIYFKRGSSDRFDPFWTVNVLFAPQVLGFDMIWAHEVYASPLRSGFHSYHSDVSELLCGQIERVALPLLRQVQTIDDFVAFNTAERFPLQQLDGFPYIKVYIHIARGDFDAALKICDCMRAQDKDGYYWMPKTYDVITNKLHPMLIANDRAGLAQYLRDCEQADVKARGLAHLWEPTPFPLELQSSQR
jgi:hypothetical protein